MALLLVPSDFQYGLIQPSDPNSLSILVDHCLLLLISLTIYDMLFLSPQMFVYLFLLHLCFGWLKVIFLYKEAYWWIFQCVSLSVHGNCREWQGLTGKPYYHHQLHVDGCRYFNFYVIYYFDRHFAVYFPLVERIFITELSPISSFFSSNYTTIRKNFNFNPSIHSVEFCRLRTDFYVSSGTFKNYQLCNVVF